MKPTKMAGSASWPRATPRGRRAGATGARRCGASASPSSASQKERVRPADEATLRQRTRDLARRNPAVTGLAMRLKRDRQTGGADASFKSSAFMSSLIESTRPPSAEYAEMYVAAVRSWLRSEWWAPQRRRLA